MSKWLPKNLRNIYGVGLYREVAPEGCPNKVLKLGQTGSTNPLDRIRYRGSDEPYPITDAFEKQCNIDFITCPVEDANWLEWTFQDVLREPGRPFHDREVWEEPANKSGYPPCGVTEMCPWSDDKGCLLLSLFEAYREGRIKRKC
jgi:hypothetical protein